MSRRVDWLVFGRPQSAAMPGLRRSSITDPAERERWERRLAPLAEPRRVPGVEPGASVCRLVWDDRVVALHRLPAADPDAGTVTYAFVGEGEVFEPRSVLATADTWHHWIPAERDEPIDAARLGGLSPILRDERTDQVRRGPHDALRRLAAEVLRAPDQGFSCRLPPGVRPGNLLWGLIDLLGEIVGDGTGRYWTFSTRESDDTRPGLPRFVFLDDWRHSGLQPSHFRLDLAAPPPGRDRYLDAADALLETYRSGAATGVRRLLRRIGIRHERHGEAERIAIVLKYAEVKGIRVAGPVVRDSEPTVERRVPAHRRQPYPFAPPQTPPGTPPAAAAPGENPGRRPTPQAQASGAPPGNPRPYGTAGTAGPAAPPPPAAERVGPPPGSPPVDTGARTAGSTPPPPEAAWSGAQSGPAQSAEPPSGPAAPAETSAADRVGPPPSGPRPDHERTGAADAGASRSAGAGERSGSPSRAGEPSASVPGPAPAVRAADVERAGSAPQGSPPTGVAGAGASAAEAWASPPVVAAESAGSQTPATEPSIGAPGSTSAVRARDVERAASAPDPESSPSEVPGSRMSAAEPGASSSVPRSGAPSRAGEPPVSVPGSAPAERFAGMERTGAAPGATGSPPSVAEPSSASGPAPVVGAGDVERVGVASDPEGSPPSGVASPGTSVAEPGASSSVPRPGSPSRVEEPSASVPGSAPAVRAANVEQAGSPRSGAAGAGAGGADPTMAPSTGSPASAAQASGATGSADDPENRPPGEAADGGAEAAEQAGSSASGAGRPAAPEAETPRSATAPGEVSASAGPAKPEAEPHEAVTALRMEPPGGAADAGGAAEPEPRRHGAGTSPSAAPEAGASGAGITPSSGTGPGDAGAGTSGGPESAAASARPDAGAGASGSAGPSAQGGTQAGSPSNAVGSPEEAGGSEPGAAARPERAAEASAATPQPTPGEAARPERSTAEGADATTPLPPVRSGGEAAGGAAGAAAETRPVAPVAERGPSENVPFLVQRLRTAETSADVRQGVDGLARVVEGDARARAQLRDILIGNGFFRERLSGVLPPDELDRALRDLVRCSFADGDERTLRRAVELAGRDDTTQGMRVALLEAVVAHGGAEIWLAHYGPSAMPAIPRSRRPVAGPPREPERPARSTHPIRTANALSEFKVPALVVLAIFLFGTAVIFLVGRL
jgi:hypothetical protein